MALFGEKYGDRVRVVSVGDWARELCGGTHADSSGQLGVVKLLGESSIGSGVRRVEALVGADAYRFLAREHVLVAQLSEALKARPGGAARAGRRHRRAAARGREGARAGAVAQLLVAAAELAADAVDVDGVALISLRHRRRRRGRPAHAGARRARPARQAQPGAVVLTGSGRQGRGRGRDQRPRPRRAASRPTTVLAAVCRSSAAAAAARTTSPRAAAPTQPRIDEALAAVDAPPSRAAGRGLRRAARRTARHRPG